MLLVGRARLGFGQQVFFRCPLSSCEKNSFSKVLAKRKIPPTLQQDLLALRVVDIWC